ncbi:MAG: peptidase MA family metallohydrolase [Anaerolineales bacterium]|nr:peptidase MA family metallohydrolase [Anaerolineales bacterium]
MSRNLLAIFILILWPTLSAASPFQMGAEQIEWNHYLDYRFGETLTLKGKLYIQDMPKEANLIIQSGQQTFVQPLRIDQNGTFEYQHNLQQVPLRPFAWVELWVEGVLANGTAFTTSKKTFLYEDNRFPWKTRTQGTLRVHWRQGDLQFAQTALDVAKEAQNGMLKWFPIELNNSLDLYIYETPGELRQALQIHNGSWVGAHADPDLGVILIAVSEGLDQRLQMEQQIPHEMMHIYLYHYQPSAYSNLPVWLNEGLATAAEFYPNPEYFTLLETAKQNQSFLPLDRLCQTFPQEAAAAYLAYAQSAAIVQYLIEQYGVEKIRQLIGAYAEQLDCDAGFYRTYGFSLAHLEDEWQKARFGESGSARALANLAPWGVFLVFVLFVPVILSWKLIAHSSSRKEEK